MADIAAPAGDRISKVIFDWLKEFVVAVGIISFAREFFGCGRTLGFLKQDVTDLALTLGPLVWVGIATYIAGTTLIRRYSPPGRFWKITPQALLVLVAFAAVSALVATLCIAVFTPVGTVHTNLSWIDGLFDFVSTGTAGKVKCDH